MPLTYCLPWIIPKVLKGFSASWNTDQKTCYLCTDCMILGFSPESLTGINRQPPAYGSLQDMATQGADKCSLSGNTCFFITIENLAEGEAYTPLARQTGVRLVLPDHDMWEYSISNVPYLCFCQAMQLSHILVQSTRKQKCIDVCVCARMHVCACVSFHLCVCRCMGTHENMCIYTGHDIFTISQLWKSNCCFPN